jgi:hypothetical protein
VNAISTGLGRPSYQRHKYKPEATTIKTHAAKIADRCGRARAFVASIADAWRRVAAVRDNQLGGRQLTLPKTVVRMRSKTVLAARSTRRSSSDDEAEDTRRTPIGTFGAIVGGQICRSGARIVAKQWRLPRVGLLDNLSPRRYGSSGVPHGRGNPTRDESRPGRPRAQAPGLEFPYPSMSENS